MPADRERQEPGTQAGTMARVLLVILLAMGAVALLRWFINTPAAKVAKALRRLMALALLAMAGFLALRGAVNIAVPMALSAFAMLRNAGGGGLDGEPSGRISEVRTRLLRMELDHDSGRMRGEILAGRFAGRALEGLEDEELAIFWQECTRAGDQSLRLLKAWIERERPDWLKRYHPGTTGHGEDSGASNASGGPGGPGAGNRSSVRGSGRMSVEEALEVLGLQPGASERDIRAAHRRLLKSVHPDHGGSDWLARQINEARDVLLAALDKAKNEGGRT